MIASDEWWRAPVKVIDEASVAAAAARQASLTKPPGSLGELETVVVRLAGLQRRDRPRLDRIAVCIFAADHGVAAEGVSAFPQAVTAEMIKNFKRGGAAICVLSRALGARLEVVNLGTAFETGASGSVRSLALGPGSRNFVSDAAMDSSQLTAALDAGRDSVRRALEFEAELYLGGDMGIGNTTSAAALGCAILGADPEILAGPGTGLDPRGVAHKVEVIRRALAFHEHYLGEPKEVLRRLGGFEIAALVGAYIACAQMGLPALIDGFIASAAALVAQRLVPEAETWWLYAHRSREPGHSALLAALGARPLLDLNLRLGEGSGAAVAVSVLRLACELHGGMATFAEAGVSGKL
jgi:nicotinate-nucleotide--dimethylbenzimidazole phosphoribosyltransferase